MQLKDMGDYMTNREKGLRKRKKDFKWSKIGMIGVRRCPICDDTNTIQIYRYDVWACRDCNEWLDVNCGDSTCPYSRRFDNLNRQ